MNIHQKIEMIKDKVEDPSTPVKDKLKLIQWIEKNRYEDDILTFTVVNDSIVSEVREDLIDTYIENARRCIQKDRGLSIPNCPIKVDFEIGPSWGELNEYK